MALERMLGDVARQGFARVDPDLLREVAERLWYVGEVPNLAEVPAKLRPDAGYLVDRLARFNVLPKEQKLRLLSAVRQYQPPLPAPSAGVARCKDPLAVAWGASMDLTSRLGELMPYQTRQYAADKAKAA
ncbi:hypothetical protein [Aromatoleum bremense]|uniref:Uncharacterized protein n=1 Tax=Aromatoleum bremense TaxID=76115 RepID=A0ABX1P066_9RHOO|nr:hypothetical protein [Aromatoleum bremense]NMG17661.1 hypothetical protein [Aromatoleum bremense]QTQ30264.1 Uncharacterized protein pbN1_02720 [Aromatoleum bremense]